MRVVNFAVLSLVALTACGDRANDRETGRMEGADTTVTTEQTLDTTIVTQDTSVDVDTTHKEGDKPVDRDTIKQ